MKAMLAGCALLVAGILGACNENPVIKAGESKTQKDTANYTTVQWIDSLVNFGTLTMGEKTKIKFRFKNTGDKPLVIADVRPGCGCTVADYTKEPVLPGAEGLVTAAFDTNRAHPGVVRKNMMVTANTKGQQHFELIFTGEIKEVK